LRSEGKIKDSCKVLCSNHLGTKGINRIKQDINGNPILPAEEAINNEDTRPKKVIQNENTEKRLAVIAKQIVEKINNK